MEKASNQSFWNLESSKIIYSKIHPLIFFIFYTLWSINVMISDKLFDVWIWTSYNTTGEEKLRNQVTMEPFDQKRGLKHARTYVEIVISLVPYNLTGRWAPDQNSVRGIG